MPRKPSARSIARALEESYLRNRSLVEQAMQKASPGTQSYLKHIETLNKIDAAYREERRKCGLDPQNLGNAVRPKWVFVAHIGTDGSITTVEVKPEDVATTVSQNAARMRERTKDWYTPEAQKLRGELESEYPDAQAKEESNEG